MCCTKSFARLHAEGALGQATKWVCLENGSVITQITVVPELLGYSTMKSMDISFMEQWDQPQFLATQSFTRASFSRGTYWVTGHIIFYVLFHVWSSKLVCALACYSCGPVPLSPKLGCQVAKVGDHGNKGQRALFFIKVGLHISLIAGNQR